MRIFLNITGRNIYNGYSKLRSAFGFRSDSMFWVVSVDVINNFNFPFQRLGSYCDESPCKSQWIGYVYTNSKPSTQKGLKKDLWGCCWSCRSLALGHWSCTPVQWNSYFYSYTYEKTYLAVHCIGEYIFFKLLTKKLWV